ncbi:hypothetical protein NDU88_010599 [Pleurodeles waltl]|uniref:Uncharacterized protein n=1 Tax=Pleurodeles waltl TaxID=8319 RepID=A0AAV7Q0L6_PLEWA|nr:hypothetical protein NDU88_010599 [Pleurodeles waltl]
MIFAGVTLSILIAFHYSAGDVCVSCKGEVFGSWCHSSDAEIRFQCSDAHYPIKLNTSSIHQFICENNGISFTVDGYTCPEASTAQPAKPYTENPTAPHNQGWSLEEIISAAISGVLHSLLVLSIPVQYLCWKCRTKKEDDQQQSNDGERLPGKEKDERRSSLGENREANHTVGFGWSVNSLLPNMAATLSKSRGISICPQQLGLSHMVARGIAITHGGA